MMMVMMVMMMVVVTTMMMMMIMVMVMAMKFRKQNTHELLYEIVERKTYFLGVCTYPTNAHRHPKTTRR